MTNNISKKRDKLKPKKKKKKLELFDCRSNFKSNLFPSNVHYILKHSCSDATWCRLGLPGFQNPSLFLGNGACGREIPLGSITSILARSSVYPDLYQPKSLFTEPVPENRNEFMILFVALYFAGDFISVAVFWGNGAVKGDSLWSQFHRYSRSSAVSDLYQSKSLFTEPVPANDLCFA
ncbi:hypothetical protein AVEN_71619-1 [Araneus ventricosus]|uniref:Uncharacterized protein n=1 Tax=Araneus ventricosus TaxID=182803 RepID=A0A4Y2GFE3_ARAVE|nr:hypothetical protein AVEN_71619-1 [Araneus ventricosus]